MIEEVQPKILVIDDDSNHSSFLKRALGSSGYHVDVAEDGPAGLHRTLSTNPDLVILDVVLPGLDGFELCRRLRATEDMPVLMLTGRGALADRVHGLECGADDYLLKPFALIELQARVRALLRRRNQPQMTVLRFADLYVDQSSHEVRRGERRLDLTPKQYELLTLFVRHPRQILMREQLLSQVWGFDSEAQTHVLEVYISYLRQKLEAGGERRLLQTVRGAGYMLKE